MKFPDSIDAVQTMLAGQDYICGRALATVVFLSLKLGRPLFLEGDAGVGNVERAENSSRRGIVFTERHRRRASREDALAVVEREFTVWTDRVGARA